MAFTIQRSKGIGGSEIGILLGLSTYSTAYHLYLDKRHELPPDYAAKLQVQNSEQKEMGKYNEPTIAKIFSIRTKRKIRKHRRTLRHPQYKFMLGNPDYEQSTTGTLYDGELEVKNCNWFQKRDWTAAGVPEAYYVQLQWYLHVAQKHYGSFAVMFGGSEHRQFDIARDQPLINLMMTRAIEFWGRVESGTPPDLDFSQRGHELINALYPKHDTEKPQEVILDDPEAAAKFLRLVTYQRANKDRDGKISELQAWFKAQLQDRAEALIPGVGRLTWKSYARDGYTVKPAIVRPFITKVFDEETLAVDPEFQAEQAPRLIATGVRALDLD